VWVDQLRLKARCTMLEEAEGLNFFTAETREMGERLCRQSGLRPLSAIVGDVLDSVCDAEPSEGERKLHNLVNSAEFVQGLCACAGIAQPDAVRKLLESLEWGWSQAPLWALLRILSTGALLDGSGVEQFAYAELRNDAPNRLWIQTGVLGSDLSSELLRILGDLVLPQLLLAGSVAVAPDRSHYTAMLGCWRGGPSTVNNNTFHVSQCDHALLQRDFRRSPLTIHQP